MDLDEEIKSKEEGEIGSEIREKGDLLPCSPPPSLIVSLLNHDNDGNKSVTNLHIWLWKTKVLHALHVHFSSFDISQTFSFFPRREMTVLQLCGRREHMLTYVQFCLVTLSQKRWFQFNFRIFRTHFASAMTLNNCKIIEETRIYIFRRRSRRRRRRLCLSSLCLGSNLGHFLQT